MAVGTDHHGAPIFFKHPAVQTAFMFAGEALCLIPFFIGQLLRKRSTAGPAAAQGAEPHRDSLRTALMFALPAMCDAGATTLLNLGLFYTYASVFQMLRGTLVVFAAVLTVVLLKRRLRSHNYLGIVLITAGAALVGASSLLYGKSDRAAGGQHASAAPNPLLGDALVISAQFLNALQFILEEKYLRRLKAPVLLAVGAEGLAGLALSAVALPMLASVRGPDGLPVDDAAAAVRQIGGSATLQWTTAATVLSIAAFNFCGVSVTKSLSGTARAAIDACRTAIIWLFCLRMGWEKFHMLQVVGFAILISGTSVYNDILRSCMPLMEPAPAAEVRAYAARHRNGTGGRRSRGSDTGDVEQPLMSGSDSEDADDALAAGPALPVAHAPQRQRGEGEESVRSAVGRETVVTFAEPGPAPRPRPARGVARPRAIAGWAPPSPHFTMARSVTMLPAALSPHSLGSLPSSAWQLESVPSSEGLRMLRAELESSTEGSEDGSGSETEQEAAVPPPPPALPRRA